MFLGDLHGNIKAALALAIRLQVIFGLPLASIFQVGDFGFWPTGAAAKNEDPHYKKDDALDLYEIGRATDPYQYFRWGNAQLESLNAPVYLIRGNHEDFKQLDAIAALQPVEVTSGIYFIPDYFQGVICDISVVAVGGILTDLERGRGKRAKDEFKKAQHKLNTDRRRSNALSLGKLKKQGIDLLLTHSGLASREQRDGSTQLQAYLQQSSGICLHFYGHHHRFSIGDVGASTVSIGLRNLESDASGILRPGSFALIAWNNRSNFSIYSDLAVRG